LALYEFEGKRPNIGNSTYISPQAIIIGEVHIGDKCFIGPGTVIRGDYGKIIINNGSAIEENCIIHAEPGSSVIIEDNVVVGHGAIIHGPCLLENNAVIGMASVICARTKIGTKSLLGAGSLLPPGQTVPKGKLAYGNPASVIRDMNEKDLEYNKIAFKTYQDLAIRCTNNLKKIPD
jgi:carbonic anhydrase/acetyltransferase-like protein (isoleucine patch superfamily)